MEHTITLSEVGGKVINKMKQCNPGLSTDMTAIKQEACQIPTSPEVETTSPEVETQGTLLVTIDKEEEVAEERFQVPEDILFPALVDLVRTAIDKADTDYLFNHTDLIVTGGCANIPGLKERLARELPDLHLAQVCDNAGTDSWVGASCFSSLTCYKGMWVKREQYEEEGEEAFKEGFIY